MRVVLVLLMCGVGAASSEAASGRGPFGSVACEAGSGVPGPSALAVGPKATGMAVRRAAAGAAQVTRNDRADLTFELRPGTGGTVELRASRGALQVRKAVHATGEHVLELSRGRDSVSVSMSAAGLRVTRGRTTITLDPTRQDDEAGDRVRRVLAESPAVVQFRRAAEALLMAEDRTAPAVAFLLADATIGSLTGDVGAPRRMAQHLVARVRRDARPVGMALDCFTVMEQRMVEAWTDYQACWISTSPNSYYQSLCGYRWIIQVESYWFSMISCSGFNW